MKKRLLAMMLMPIAVLASCNGNGDNGGDDTNPPADSTEAKVAELWKKFDSIYGKWEAEDVNPLEANDAYCKDHDPDIYVEGAPEVKWSAVDQLPDFVAIVDTPNPENHAQTLNVDFEKWVSIDTEMTIKLKASVDADVKNKEHIYSIHLTNPNPLPDPNEKATAFWAEFDPQYENQKVEFEPKSFALGNGADINDGTITATWTLADDSDLFEISPEGDALTWDNLPEEIVSVDIVANIGEQYTDFAHTYTISVNNEATEPDHKEEIDALWAKLDGEYADSKKTVEFDEGSLTLINGDGDIKVTWSSVTEGYPVTDGVLSWEEVTEENTPVVINAKLDEAYGSEARDYTIIIHREETPEPELPMKVSAFWKVIDENYADQTFAFDTYKIELQTNADGLPPVDAKWTLTEGDVEGLKLEAVSGEDKYELTWGDDLSEDITSVALTATVNADGTDYIRNITIKIER